MRKSWSNIQVSLQDPEIVQIDNLEDRLGELPDRVGKIRELITRFEVCHFKYQRHLEIIKNSINSLDPCADSDRIGINHVRFGKIACKNDKTGKSITGQKYIQAIKEWLKDDHPAVIFENYDTSFTLQVQRWLGNKSPDKIRLVRLLLARLNWEWKSHEELQEGGEFRELELQASRMDICHYAFPENLDRLLQQIGLMKPVNETEFAGCGSYNDHIKAYIEKEMLDLNGLLESLMIAGQSDKNELIKAWLIACLAKTIKEDVNSSIPIAELVF